MERTERFYKIDRLLRENRFVTIERFLDELSVSRATFKRDIEYMRQFVGIEKTEGTTSTRSTVTRRIMNYQAYGLINQKSSPYFPWSLF